MALAPSVALGLLGCGGLAWRGGKPPANLVTLTPEAAEPASIARTAAAGQAVTIEAPAVPHELGTCACRCR